MFNDGSGTTLFVGDLASFCDEKHIQEIFIDHGFEVVDVKLMRGKQSMSTLNYGFVQLRSNADAMKAIAVLDSKLIHGRKLRVNWAQPNMKLSRQSESNNSVYVKFQALTPDQIVTEERLREIFSTFGPVIDVSIKSSHLQAKPPDERDSGYGFVHFCEGNEGVAAAFKSIASLTIDSVYDDVEYVVEASQNFLKQVQNSHKGKLATNSNQGRNMSQQGMRRSNDEGSPSPFKPDMSSYQPQLPQSGMVNGGQRLNYQQQPTPPMNGKFRPQQDPYRSQQSNGRRALPQQSPVQYGYPSHSSSPYTPQVEYDSLAQSRGVIPHMQYYDRQMPFMSGTMEFTPAAYAPPPGQYGGYPSSSYHDTGYSPAMHMQQRHFVASPSFEAPSPNVPSRHGDEDPRHPTRGYTPTEVTPRRNSPPRASPHEKMFVQEGYDRQQDLYESYKGSPTLRRGDVKSSDDQSIATLSFGVATNELPISRQVGAYSDSPGFISREKQSMDRPPGLESEGDVDVSSLMRTMKINPEENTFGRRLNDATD